MRFRFHIFTALIFALLSPSGMAQFGFGAAPSNATETGVANVTTVQPGVPFYAGIEIEIQPTWHTYWKNSGSDIGKPTAINWTLPEGFTVGELIYPTPHYAELFGIPTHVHSGTVYHVAKITPPADLEPGTTVALAGKVEMQVCDDETCEQERDRFIKIELPVSADPPTLSQFSGAIEAMLDDSPMRLPKWETKAEADGEDAVISVTIPEGATIPTEGLYFFPETRLLVADGKPAQSFSVDGNTLNIRIKKGKNFAGEISGLLHAESEIAGEGKKTVYISTPAPKTAFPSRGMGADSAPVRSDPVTATPASTVSTAVTDIDNVTPEQKEEIRAAIKTVASWVKPELDKADGKRSLGALLAMIGAGFIGGIALNLMPCVFPVLGIKIMGFVAQAGEDKAKIRNHGLVFAVGVLTSLWALVGVLLAIKYILGDQVSWGFQLQNPAFLAVMIVVMVVFGLNLAGLFEFGTSLTSAGSGLQQKHGYSGSFFSGVLAVLVATPCTGPFVGPAIGFALTGSDFHAFAIFTALGLGLALPYVVLSFFPALIQKLPKPGPWMETLKQFMAFPMFLTAAWLIGVFSRVTGQGAVPWLLYGLTTLALALWILGRYSTPISTPKGKGIARCTTLLVAAFGAWLMFSATKKQPEAAGIAGTKTHHGVEWHSFDPRELIAVRESGRPIFIDFTADN